MTLLSKLFPEAFLGNIKRLQHDFLGLLLIGSSLFLCLSFATHDSFDPSSNTAVSAQIHNWGGTLGAFLSDWALALFGVSSFLAVPVMFGWGIQLILRPHFHFGRRFVLLTLSLIFFSAAFSGFFFSNISISTISFLPHFSHHIEGSFGILLVQKTYEASLHFHFMTPFFVLGLFYLCIGLSLYYFSFGISYRKWVWGISKIQKILLIPYVFSQKIASFFRIRSSYRPTEFHTLSDFNFSSLETEEPSCVEASVEPSPVLKQKNAPKKMSTPSSLPLFLDLEKYGEYNLPPLDLLEKSSQKSEKKNMTEAELQEKARELEAVLEEFGIRGDIEKVRPGPVVTLYELTPAPGIKSSRIIGLSDDIARSMSAVSTRVAVIPGQNALGIELPNGQREVVYLRELFETSAFEKSAAPLALALGKDIGGSPVIVDLARMPHLLVAGTTGSGKSVAINTMILSLLYRLPPDRCKFIMIDPKMLELSIYEGIPHLLAPVVTDPKKAIVALKWTTREMEDRYRAMSKLGVRNIDGYNLRILTAKEKGEILTRRVQTGFDTETGLPLFEDQPFDLTPLPYIVVIVDEMADLMLVAGKEIESTIQRLAQMARAAGIHLIMATQRPSVDVITGTIKANFPTRVSFQVTSKIDSRTILGEQGAEQLLGQGDMLYMAAGGRITRLHGPFVKDGEVEKIVRFLCDQGAPTYLQDITADETEGTPSENDSSSKDPLYQEALDLVLRERKASTSFIQRHLQIGYNRAARLIDQMEAEGVISAANHVGKREILGPM